MGFGHFLEGEDGVTQSRGFFVVAFLGCCAHFGFDIAEYIGAASVEEFASFVESCAVLILRDAPEAWRGARSYHVG